MFWVLRRWGASLAAAALGGAVFGFSPALRIAAVGHYHLQFAVLLPLIIDALLRLVTGRGRPVRTGAWLGLLTAAQLFIAEETVALTAVAGVVIVVVLAAGRPRAVPGLVRGTVTGLAAAAGVLVVTCGYPLWVQFHGPLAEQGSPWKLGHFRQPPGRLRERAQRGAAALPGHAWRTWPATRCGWSSTSPTWAGPCSSCCSLAAVLLLAGPAGPGAGGDLRGAGGVQPRQPHRRAARPALPGRPAALVLPAAAAAAQPEPAQPVLAAGGRRGRRGPGFLPGSGLGTGRETRPSRRLARRCPGPAPAAEPAAPVTSGARARGDPARPLRPPQTPRSRPRAPAWRKAAAVALIALAVVPIIPLPLQAAAVIPTPAGWQQAFARLRLASDAPVLVVPVQPATVMRWQADTGVPGSVIGGYCIAPAPGTGKAELCATSRKPTAGYLNDLWQGNTRSRSPRPPPSSGPTWRTGARPRSWRSPAGTHSSGVTSAMCSALPPCRTGACWPGGRWRCPGPSAAGREPRSTAEPGRPQGRPRAR